MVSSSFGVPRNEDQQTTHCQSNPNMIV